MKRHLFISFGLMIIAVISAVVTVRPPRALATDVITVGYDQNLQLLDAWDPAKNPDSIIDISGTMDRGNLAVPFGGDLYISGGAGLASAQNGFLMKYNQAIGRVLSLGGSKWIVTYTNMNGGTRAMAVDTQGDVYTGYTYGSGMYGGAPGVSKFSKYSGVDGSLMNTWPRSEPTPCGVVDSIYNMVVNNGMFYALGADCSPFKWRMVAMSAGVSDPSLTRDWLYQREVSYPSRTTFMGTLAIGNAAGTQYLYVFAAVTDHLHSDDVYSIVRYKINGNTIETSPDVGWGEKIEDPHQPMTVGQIAVDKNTGAVYVAGTYADDYGWQRYYTVKYDSAGNRIWNVLQQSDGKPNINSGQTNIASGIAISPDGSSVYVTGKSFGVWGRHFYTVQYDTGLSHAVLQNSISDFGMNEQALGIGTASNGTVYVTGFVDGDSVSNKANLVASDLKPSGDPTKLADVTFTGRVRNISDNTARPFYTVFCVDLPDCKDVTTTQQGQSIGFVRRGIALNGNTSVSPDPQSEIWHPIDGEHTITMCADPYNVVPETDETDNCTSQTYQIDAGGGGGGAKPEAVIHIYAQPDRVRYNGSAKISWDGTNVLNCHISRVTDSGSTDENWVKTSDIEINAEGTIVGTKSKDDTAITEKTTYTLFCSNANKPAEVSVTINLPPYYEPF